MIRYGSVLSHILTVLFFYFAHGDEHICTDDGECGANHRDDNDLLCADKHERCGLWMEHGECLINPVYMRTACPLSCLVCTDRFQFDEEESFLRAQMFSGMDLGPAQNHYRDDPDESKEAKDIIRAMEVYARNEVTRPEYDAVRSSCRNSDGNCAIWTAHGECSKNPGFMMVTCPLACRKCDQLQKFERCAFLPVENVDIKEGDINSLFSQGVQDLWSHLEPEVLSQPVAPNDNSPWVVKIDKFLSDKECEHLVSLAERVGWSKALSEDLEDTVGRTKNISLCNTEDCMRDNMLAAVQEKVSSLLRMPTNNFEFVEFEQFNFGDSFGVHHHYITDDFWKPAGARALTVHLSLSDVDGGGAIGFPELDWLFVKPKKGQILIWSNVLNNDPRMINELATLESLPVSNGTLYGANIWIHSADWKNLALEDECS